MKSQYVQKQLRPVGGALSNGVATAAGLPTTAGGSGGTASGARSALNGRGVELNGFPMPDTDQMLAFKPIPLRTVTSHPVLGGKRLSTPLSHAHLQLQACSRRLLAQHFSCSSCRRLGPSMDLLSTSMRSWTRSSASAKNVSTYRSLSAVICGA